MQDNMRTGDLVLASEVAFAGLERIEGIMNRKRSGTTRFPDRTGIFRTAQDDRVQNHLNRLLKGKNIGVHAGRTVTCGRVIRDTM